MVLDLVIAAILVVVFFAAIGAAIQIYDERPSRSDKYANRPYSQHLPFCSNCGTRHSQYEGHAES